MTAEEIKDAVRKLGAELDGLEEVDGELAARLKELDGEIHEALERGGGEDGGAEDEDGLGGRVEELAAGFAADHPEAEGLLRRVAYALGRMGI